MIEINLLPWREELKRARARDFKIRMALAAVIGAVLSGFAYLTMQGFIENQQDRNNHLQEENKKLDAQIAEVKGLEEEIRSLRSRQEAVERLQMERNISVHLLNDLAKQTPDGMFVDAIKQKDRVVAVSGSAQSPERVAQALSQYAKPDGWLVKADLSEMKRTNKKLNANGSRESVVQDFLINVTLKETATAEALSKSGANKLNSNEKVKN